MKKSTKIIIAGILLALLISLYQGIHHSLNAFDLMLFVCTFCVGIMAASPEKTVRDHPRVVASKLLTTVDAEDLLSLMCSRGDDDLYWAQVREQFLRMKESLNSNPLI